MQLVQAKYERTELELELKMKKLEAKHQLLEEEPELERKMNRAAIENDYVRSNSAHDRSLFNRTPKKTDVSDGASIIDNLLTLYRSTPRFAATP